MDNTTLTAIPGFLVGHWTDRVGQTGCTVILGPPGGMLASASFLGPSPGTREGILLSPDKKIERVHALLLTGGSAFGLAAASGVVRFLEERGVGHPTPAAKVPLVPAAVIYDLLTGDPQARPDDASGYAAAQAASGAAVETGPFGAGTGATVGKYLGPERLSPGGLGSSLVERAGVRVGCLAVVNPFGDVVGPAGELLAGLGTGIQEPSMAPSDIVNTTLLAVATEHALTKPEAKRLADAAQAALARVIRPSHTPFDGDSAFVLSSQAKPSADPLLLAALVQDAVAGAVWSALGKSFA